MSAATKSRSKSVRKSAPKICTGDQRRAMTPAQRRRFNGEDVYPVEMRQRVSEDLDQIELALHDESKTSDLTIGAEITGARGGPELVDPNQPLDEPALWRRPTDAEQFTSDCSFWIELKIDVRGNVFANYAAALKKLVAKLEIAAERVSKLQSKGGA